MTMSQSQSRKPLTAEAAEVVLRWHTKSVRSPSVASIKEAVSSIAGEQVPVAILESSIGTVEVRIGEHGTLMAWLPVDGSPEISARSDLGHEEIVELLGRFARRPSRPEVVGGWRSVAWPDAEDGAEMQALRKSQKIARLREVRRSVSTDKYLWVLRATATHVAAQGIETLLGQDHSTREEEAKEVLGYDLELLVLRILEQELADA